MVYQKNIVLSSTIIFLIFLTTYFNAPAQDSKFQLHGLIVDEETQIPLIGASIQDSITGFGEISDSKGEFSLEFNKLPVVFTIRHLGYFEEILTINNRTQYKTYVDGNIIVISLRRDPFLIDEVVISDTRIALKLFEEEPFDLIDYVVREDRFIGFGYKNRNPLLREIFIGNMSGRIINTQSLDGVREIYQDCKGEIYAVTNDDAYAVENNSDVISTSVICDSEYFHDKVKPIKALDGNHFIYLQKSYDGQYHDYFIGSSKDDQQELLYRVGEWRNESKVRIAKNRHTAEERGKIKRSFIPMKEMREINSRLHNYLYSVFIEYPPVNSDMIQIGDSVLLFDYNFQEILCYKTNGELKWTTEIDIELNRDFNGKVHFDKTTGRCFLEFLNVQLTYLIEINPITGNKIQTIPILKYKHIDHIRIHNNKIFFLHQPDFGDRGKKIYYLDIS